MKYLNPLPLNNGDKVAIVAPSSPISSMIAIEKSFKVFKEHGLIPILGKNIKNLRSDYWSSASVEERIEEIEWAFDDDSIKAVIAAEGGYSAIELLPYLPYQLIREKRKLFMGMSDITAINNAILHCSKLINISGTNVRIRQDKPQDEKNLSDALELLKYKDKWITKPWKRLNSIPRCVCGGIVRGHSIGGNMTLFTSLIGTPYLPDVNGAILFLEDIYAGGHEISEMLNHMELAGILDSISGIVFGEFCKLPERDCQDMTIEDVIVRKLRDKVPCIYGMNFSHGETVATIPLGVETIINAEECFVSFGNLF